MRPDGPIIYEAVVVEDVGYQGFLAGDAVAADRGALKIDVCHGDESVFLSFDEFNRAPGINPGLRVRAALSFI